MFCTLALSPRGTERKAAGRHPSWAPGPPSPRRDPRLLSLDSSPAVARQAVGGSRSAPGPLPGRRISRAHKDVPRSPVCNQRNGPDLNAPLTGERPARGTVT